MKLDKLNINKKYIIAIICIILLPIVILCVIKLTPSNRNISQLNNIGKKIESCNKKLKDSLDDSEYVLDEGMDMLHSLSFMNKILSYPLKSNSIKEGQEEWGDEIYIQVDSELFLENEHFDTAWIFINKKTKTPIGIIVYDKEGNDSLRIIYYDFKKVKGFDESIFN